MSMSWTPDTLGYGAVSDDYGQWSMGAGHKFEVTRNMPKDAPGDFDYMLGAPVPGEGPFFGRVPIRAASAGALASGDALPGMALPAASVSGDVTGENLVLVGLIDSSVNVAHRRFRTASGASRIEGAWIMDGAAAGGTPFGRHLTGAEITQAIATYGTHEDDLLAALDLTSATNSYRPTQLNRRASHGTHVADIAAGYPPEADRHDIRLAAVSLPVFAVQDTSGAGLLVPILAGIDYVYAVARGLSDAYGRAVPVVLNLSFGFRAGPANGTHVIERALRGAHAAYEADMAAKFAASAPVASLVSAGNGQLAQSHLQGQGKALDAVMRVQPDDRTSSFVEVWVPRGADKIRVTLTEPGQTARTLFFKDLDPADLPPARLLAPSDATDLAATAVARVSVQAPAAALPAQGDVATEPFWRLLIALGPSATDRADGLGVAHGDWAIRVVAKNVDGTKLDGGALFARIQRDEGLLGFARYGRQSYFSDPIYDAHRFEAGNGDLIVSDVGIGSPVTRNGTVSGTATNRPSASATDLIAVGAALWDTGGASAYSAAGTGDYNAPDLMAAADTSRVLPGILGAGSRGATPVALNGTSVAAPQATRLLAEALCTTPPASYPGFAPRDVLATMASVPTRPSPSRPERRSNTVIRSERVQAGVLPVPPTLTTSVTRGAVPKR